MKKIRKHSKKQMSNVGFFILCSRNLVCVDILVNVTGLKGCGKTGRTEHSSKELIS